MTDYLYQDERGDIIITPMVTQRGEGWEHAGEWSAGNYYLSKDDHGSLVTKDFHDPRGLTFKSEEEALRVTIRLAEERIKRDYESLFI